jgi:hypothetical protein
MNHNKHEYTEEEVQKELAIPDNNTKFKIHCTARGIEGRIFDTRICKENNRQHEYLIFNKKTFDVMWLNNNGYCEFDTIN